MKDIVIGIVLLLFTGILVVSVVNEKRNYAALQREGIRGDVEIRRAAIVKTRGGPSYRLYLDHAVDAGKIHTEKHVPQHVYEDYAQGAGASPPRTLSIRYLPRNPKIFEIIDPRIPSDYYAPSRASWSLVVLLGMVAMSVLSGGLRSRKESRLRSYPPAP